MLPDLRMTSPPTLSLLCGMAGAGKTTLARRIERQPGAIRFSPDEWIVALMADTDDRAEMDRLRPLVEQLQWSEAEKLLEAGVSVVLENGFWRREERLERVRAARQLDVRLVLHFLDPPRGELLRRIAQRNKSIDVGALRISEEELDEWLGWLERPDAQEYGHYDAFEIHTGE